MRGGISGWSKEKCHRQPAKMLGQTRPILRELNPERRLKRCDQKEKSSVYDTKEEIYSPMTMVQRQYNNCPTKASVMTLLLPRKSATFPYGTTARITRAGLRINVFKRQFGVQMDSHKMYDMACSQLSNSRICCAIWSSK